MSATKTPTGVSTIADCLGMHPSSTARMLKEATGLSGVYHIQRRRIVAAQEFLLNTSLSIEEVARKSGFTGHHYFDRVFFNWTNQRPTAYRKLGHLSKRIHT